MPDVMSGKMVNGHLIEVKGEERGIPEGKEEKTHSVRWAAGGEGLAEP